MSADDIFKNRFAFEAAHYERDLNTFKQYVEISAKYLHDRTGRPLEQCEEFIRKSLRKGGQFEFKDPKIQYLQRKENGDREMRETTLSRYLGESLHSKDVIAPTFTTYIDPKKKESLLAKFIRNNIKARGLAKKAMFKAKADKDFVLENVKKTEQKGRKTSNNSLSGAHISASTPLRNKTAHPSLTSTCRTTSGYGNANNEKFVIGNRHYYNYQITLNNIVTITKYAEYDLIEAVMKKYNLHYPTVEDTMECITYSTRVYWWDRVQLGKLKDYVATLSPLQRAAFVYTSDFYHLRKFNDEFVRSFIDRLAARVIGECADPLAIINRAPENYVNLGHQICYPETMDIGKDYHKIKKPEDLCTLALTIENIGKTITEYSDLIRALWMPQTVPASVSQFPASIRKTALTSDTDSTIFTVQDWVKWHGKGSMKLNLKARGVYCSVVFLASATITHVLAIMSANLGIVNERIFDIQMKNEFSFDIFIPTNLGKHYFAAISCTEGNVVAEFEYETKGVGMKAANTPKAVREDAEKMRMDIIHDVFNDMKISLYKYLKHVSDVEVDIANVVKAGGLKYYRNSSIKDAGSYAGEPEASPYQNHFLWNEVFAPKYGEMPLPPYSTMKISTATDTPTSFKEWLNGLEDKEFAARMKDYCERNQKTSLSTYNLPRDIVMSSGVPKEVREAVNYTRIVKDICKIYYIQLETLGFFTKTTVSEALGIAL